MEIVLSDVGKQFQKNWIFRHFSYHFKPTEIVGVRGENGSGKSTLLSVISSIRLPSEGSVVYKNESGEFSFEKARLKIGIASPSIEFIPNETVESLIQFHFQFRDYFTVENQNDFLELCWLDKSKSLLVKELSSGMLQRLKLALAFFSNNEFILLDEPTSNLDQRGIDFVQYLIENHLKGRSLVIASNEERDFHFCQKELNIQDYKQQDRT